MPKVADVKLSWAKSPSLDVSKVEVAVTKNGTMTVSEFGPEVESFVIEVEASSAVQFVVTVYDTEGKQATSDVYSFNIGDLEIPQPATNLFHEVLAVRDVPVPA